VQISSTAWKKPEITHHETSAAWYEQTAGLKGDTEFEIKCNITAKKKK